MCYKLVVSSKIKKFFALLILGIFLIVGGLGVLYSFGMNMGSNEDMFPCPFMAQGSSMCTMTPLEHISAWQNMLTALPVGNILLATLLIFTFVSVLLSRIILTRLEHKLLSIYRFRYRKRFTERNYLQEAYSAGLLNPKTF